MTTTRFDQRWLETAAIGIDGWRVIQDGWRLVFAAEAAHPGYPAEILPTDLRDRLLAEDDLNVVAASTTRSSA